MTTVGGRFWVRRLRTHHHPGERRTRTVAFPLDLLHLTKHAGWRPDLPRAAHHTYPQNPTPGYGRGGR